MQGVYPHGGRLPSKRTLAAETGVSTVTAEHAYALLCDEGYAESRERSGYFVCFRAGDGFAAAPQPCRARPKEARGMGCGARLSLLGACENDAARARRAGRGDSGPFAERGLSAAARGAAAISGAQPRDCRGRNADRRRRRLGIPVRADCGAARAGQGLRHRIALLQDDRAGLPRVGRAVRAPAARRGRNRQRGAAGLQRRRAAHLALPQLPQRRDGRRPPSGTNTCAGRRRAGDFW